MVSGRSRSGFAFAYISRTKSLLYNPNLVAMQNLPKTHAELGNAKYKRIWTQPPWTTHWEPGPLALPEVSKEKWIEVVRRAGKNAGAKIIDFLDSEKGLEFLK